MQQDNRKKIGLLIIIVGLLIIIAIIYFGFFRNKEGIVEAPTGPTINTNQLPSGTSSEPVIETVRDENATYDLSKEKPHKINANDVAKIGMAFAERFGSYSNQSSYGNFTDLKIWMTDNMKDWADTYVNELKASSTNQTSYYGITTNSLTSEVKKFDDDAGTAQIIITTKRQENTNDSNSKEAYVQKLDLDFKKVNNEWLVDRAYWEK